MTHAVHPIQWLRSACASVISKVSGAESPWERVPMDVPVAAFGPGSATPFARYFEDESRVEVRSIDDIVAWLASCEYMSDADQFHERDVWQPPSSFERRQRGDCEDFALWAWRKLAEIGVDAEFFVGRVTGGGDPAVQSQHAWIVFRVDGDEVLFEPAARDRERMLQPLSAVKDAYVPHFSVDRHFVTCAFVGCLLTFPG
jgi:hypothetical protein